MTKGATPASKGVNARPISAPMVRSAAQMEEDDAAAARKGVQGAPSDWARRQTAEIRQVREELRAARKEAYGVEVPLSGGDGFRVLHAGVSSRHNRPLSAGRVHTGVTSPQQEGSPIKSGERGKQRWLVPARGLNNKERLTLKERLFQERLEEKRRGSLENNEAALLREQARRDLMLPWWERSEKEERKSAGNGRWRPSSSSPTRSPSPNKGRVVRDARLLSPNDPLRAFQMPCPLPPKSPAKLPQAVSKKQVAALVGRSGQDAGTGALAGKDLAEEVATQVLLNRWGHALARLLEATAAHKRRHDYIAADGRMDLDEFRRLLRTGFDGEGPRGEGAVEGFGDMAVSDSEVRALFNCIDKGKLSVIGLREAIDFLKHRGVKACKRKSQGAPRAATNKPPSAQRAAEEVLPISLALPVQKYKY